MCSNGLLATGFTFAVLLATALPAVAEPDDFKMPEERFVKVTAKVRPGVVAVGSYHKNDTPTVKYFGTGFVINSGLTVATNQHVVEAIRRSNRLDEIRVFLAVGERIQGRAAKVIAEDHFHDVAILRMQGPAAPALKMVSKKVGHPPQGRGIGIIGFPVGIKLGLVPAVHKGVVAAVVPAVLPLPKGAKMTPELAKARREPFMIYQMDLLALPGNSGSPLFDARTGNVIGIINKVLGSRTREHLITNPSGISYAIPIRWVQDLVIRSVSVTDGNAGSAP